MEDNIKIDVKVVGCEDMDWNHLAPVTEQWHVPLNTVVNFRFK